jgi:hypothetical protein
VRAITPPSRVGSGASGAATDALVALAGALVVAFGGALFEVSHAAARRTTGMQRATQEGRMVFLIESVLRAKAKSASRNAPPLRDYPLYVYTFESGRGAPL